VHGIQPLATPALFRARFAGKLVPRFPEKMSSSDGNYSCMVCGGGRERCCALHCETCGDHSEFTCECEARDHRECSGGEEGCSESDVRFRIRDDQPLLDVLDATHMQDDDSSDSDDNLAAVVQMAANLRKWGQAQAAKGFAGLYDGEDVIVPDDKAVCFEHPVEFLIGDRYDSDANGWLETARLDGRTKTTFYILVDIWCAPCYPKQAAAAAAAAIAAPATTSPPTPATAMTMMTM
jgi:hypothetical protein